jgi:hypothetical protein
MEVIFTAVRIPSGVSLEFPQQLGFRAPELPSGPAGNGKQSKSRSQIRFAVPFRGMPMRAEKDQQMWPVKRLNVCAIGDE